MGEVRIARVAVGFADRYRVGHWAPVVVEIQSDASVGDAELQLLVPDGKGTASATRFEAISIVAGSQRVTAYAKLGRVDGDLTVRVVAAGGGCCPACAWP